MARRPAGSGWRGTAAGGPGSAAALLAASPALLQPFHSPAGQAVLGLAVLWMVLGYRVMQQMTQAPRDERLRLRGTGP